MKKHILAITLVSFFMSINYACQNTTSTNLNNTDNKSPIIPIDVSPTITTTQTPIPKETAKTNVKVLNIKDVPNFIVEKCAYCHSSTPNEKSGRITAAAGIKLDSEDQIISSIDAIKRVVVTEKSMPIGAIKITSKDRDTIAKWIDSKTNTQSTTLPTPSISPNLGEQTSKTKTATEIINEKCAYCHSTIPNKDSGYTQAPKSITFNNEKEMITNISKINQTAIVNKNMPMGGIKLTDKEISTISEWIKNNTNGKSLEVKAKTATEIITEKCTYCHSVTPDSSSGYTKAPKRLTFDSETEMSDKHDDIYSVVNKKEMPIKLTMTEEERGIVLQWAQKLEDEEKTKSFLYRLFH